MLLLALLVLAAPAGARCPDPNLHRTTVTLATAGGQQRYRVELADTPDRQECGLMFRRQMARDAGMWFPVDPPRTASFWMKNTFLPLDIVFVGTNGRVLTVAANAKPYSESLIDSGGTISAVLELNAGEAARVGLKVGDKVRLGKAPRR